MQCDNLLVEIIDYVAHVSINRPQALNSLDPQTVEQLSYTIRQLENNPAAKAIVISGCGDKAFAAGGDVALMRTLGPEQARAVALRVAELFRAIETSPRVVIAAINGYALGGGCELALACDMRIAADHAELGQPEINLGIFPGWGGTQRLPRLIGISKAKQLMFTGMRVKAAQALELGLVDEVVPAAQLRDHAHQLAVTIASKPQTAIRMIKEAVHNGMQMDMERAIRYEAELFGMCFATQDKQEGMDAFFEKRTPQWKDC
ncbi:MAG: enoyl-CoA hydratase-related protein [Desulfuromonas sp.]|nr:enoyl-CoA hydratase-related protein [Desulfuromonas sp.]